jgi:hypothetical protein
MHVRTLKGVRNASSANYIKEIEVAHRTSKEHEEEPPPHPPDRYEGHGYDHGIRRAVKILRENGIETCQSCEGGPGHAYPEPTVDFRGSYAAGFRAVSICLDNGLPIADLRRVWSVWTGEPEGPIWQLTFKRRMKP